MPAQLTDTYGWSMDHGSLTALEGTRVNFFFLCSGLGMA